MEFKRSALLMTRYPLQAIVGLLILFLVLQGLIFGSEYIGGPEMPTLGTGIEGVLVGFFCYVIVMTGFGHLVTEIESDAKAGTLETLFLSEYSIQSIFIMRSIVALSQSVVTLVLIGFAELQITGTQLSLSLTIVFPLLLLASMSIGLGLAAAGLALIYKHVQVVLAPVYILFLFLVSLKPEAMGVVGQALALLVPFSSPIALIRAEVTGGQLNGVFLPVAVAWTIVVILFGLWFLSVSVRRVKRLGSISAY